MGNQICSCSNNLKENESNLSQRTEVEKIYSFKEEDSNKISIDQEFELVKYRKKNCDASVHSYENGDNNIVTTRFHTDMTCNSNTKEQKVKIIQKVYRTYKWKKLLYLNNDKESSIYQNKRINELDLIERDKYFKNVYNKRNSALSFKDNELIKDDYSSNLTIKDEYNDTRVISIKNKTDEYKLVRGQNNKKFLEDSNGINLDKQNKSEDISKDFAIKIYEDGSILCGYINKKNMIEEIAIYKDKDGKKFMGEFNGFSFYGYGIFTNNGAKYEGYWNKNNKDNIGTEVYCDGSYYEGSFKKGKKDGLGFFKWDNEIIYEGEWKENKIQGFGHSRYPNGNIYWGEFSDGLFHGYGEFIWKDGRIYKGLFKDDKKNGFGLFKYPNQDKYFLGFWDDNMKDGIGCNIVSGSIKFGLWSKGLKKKDFSNKLEAIRLLNKSQLKYAKFFVESKNQLKSSIFF